MWPCGVLAPGNQIARACGWLMSRSHENVSPALTICSMNGQIAGQSSRLAALISMR